MLTICMIEIGSKPPNLKSNFNEYELKFEQPDHPQEMQPQKICQATIKTHKTQPYQ